MSVGIWVLRLSSLGLEGGERAWYTLNAHAKIHITDYMGAPLTPQSLCYLIQQSIVQPPTEEAGSGH